MLNGTAYLDRAAPRFATVSSDTFRAPSSTLTQQFGSRAQAIRARRVLES